MQLQLTKGEKMIQAKLILDCLLKLNSKVKSQKSKQEISA
jgi:hypothetical protein